jgi:hypothetical protein
VVAFKALSFSDTSAASLRNGTRAATRGLLAAPAPAAPTARTAVRAAAAPPAAGAVKAKGIASGTYTFWTSATTTGITNIAADATNPTSAEACLANCDADEACAGVVMPTGTTMATTGFAAGDCQKITGITTLNTWLRSATRADYTKFSLV